MRNNNVLINGEFVNVNTVMDKDIEYTPTVELNERLYKDVHDIIDEYFPDILHEEIGLKEMFIDRGDGQGEFWRNKGWLWDAFEKHPLYNGNGQIVIHNVDMKRHINMDGVDEFFDWADGELRKMGKEYYITLPSGEERTLTHDEYIKLKAKFEAERELCTKINNYYSNLVRARKISYGKYNAICIKSSTIRERLFNKTLSMHCDYKARKQLRALDAIKDYIYEYGNHIMDGEYGKYYIDRINKMMHDERFCTSGMKISRIVGKIAKSCNLHKVTDIQKTYHYTQDGERIETTKDFGYNYMFAMFGDSINPIALKATAVISINPVDYYTMSFGDTWASCHTIDKLNKRDNDEEHNYSGMYCSGTESYMLDDSSVVFYYLPANFNGNHPEYQDKIKRCMFYLGEDKMIQSRVYPDGRDSSGSNESAKDIRNLMSKVVSELFNVPNYWQYKKGTNACTDNIITTGTHYKDYAYYEDCGVSYMKRIDGYINQKEIVVGHETICPECGARHRVTGNIFCRLCDTNDYDD